LKCHSRGPIKKMFPDSSKNLKRNQGREELCVGIIPCFVFALWNSMSSVTLVTVVLPVHKYAERFLDLN
jgi:hypothetical protein